MLKAIVLCILFMSVSAPVLADYRSNFIVVDKKEIAKMTDEQLISTYIDALVEVQSRKDFFNRFGFKEKELDDYRSVLKYRLLLLMEIHGRNLDIPQFDRY